MTLARLMQQYVDTHNLNDLEGVRKTDLDGVWFYRSSTCLLYTSDAADDC